MLDGVIAKLFPPDEASFLLIESLQNEIERLSGDPGGRKVLKSFWLIAFSEAGVVDVTREQGPERL